MFSQLIFTQSSLEDILYVKIAYFPPKMDIYQMACGFQDIELSPRSQRAPFPSALLVVESEGVHLLVLHGPVAADAAAARLVVDGLRASDATDVRGAPTPCRIDFKS